MAPKSSSKLDAVRKAAANLADAQDERDSAIRSAATETSIRTIAVAAGLSFQRVHQIVHGK